MLASALAAVLLPIALDPPAVAPGPLLARMKAAQAKAADELGKPPAPGDKRTPAERWRDFDGAQAARFAAALKIATAHPGSPVAADAVGWALGVPRAYFLPCGPGLFRYAEQHLADKPQAAAAVRYAHRMLRENTPDHAPGLALMRAVAGKHPDRAVKGFARYALARQAFYRYAVGEYKRSPDVAALASAADAELDAVVGEFGSEVAPGSDKSLRELAGRDLHEVRNLRVGKPLPALAGRLLTGRKFDPASTRGKVTLVVFWATWCGPCMDAVPQEVKLSRQYAGRPFALVGVNGDDTAATGLAAAKEHGMTWPSVWEDQTGDTPLSKAFSVSGWPTVYLADAKGVIRYKDIHGRDLDEAVAELVAEAEAKE